MSDTVQDILYGMICDTVGEDMPVYINKGCIQAIIERLDELEGIITKRTCGNCKHWGELDKEHIAVGSRHAGFGTCTKTKHDENDDCLPYGHPIPKSWMTCVVDGSGYFAALLTREKFGCTEWEPKDVE